MSELPLSPDEEAQLLKNLLSADLAEDEERYTDRLLQLHYRALAKTNIEETQSI